MGALWNDSEVVYQI